MTGDVCVWRDMYDMHRKKKVYSTTFRGWEGWGQDNPLYGCLQCDGYDTDCTGYVSLKDLRKSSLSPMVVD